MPEIFKMHEDHSAAGGGQSNQAAGETIQAVHPEVDPDANSDVVVPIGGSYYAGGTVPTVATVPIYKADASSC